MAKHVRFNDNVQIKEMSIDKSAHAMEVKNPQGVGIPMIVPKIPIETASEISSGFSWWWIILAIVLLIIGYFVWRSFKNDKQLTSNKIS